MCSIVQNTTGQYRVLYALLAGSGLRIGEALGLEAESISKDFGTLYVRKSIWQGMRQTPKTASAVRDVDLSSDLAAMFTDFVADRKTGLVFRNAVGRPLAQSNVLRRSLHPMLESLEVPKAGFHSFRRFRFIQGASNAQSIFCSRHSATEVTHEVLQTNSPRANGFLMLLVFFR